MNSINLKSFKPGPVSIVAGPAMSGEIIKYQLGFHEDHFGKILTLTEIQNLSEDQLLMIFYPAWQVAANAILLHQNINDALLHWREQAEGVSQYLCKNRKNIHLIQYNDAIKHSSEIENLLDKPINGLKDTPEPSKPRDGMFEVLGRYAVLSRPSINRLEAELEAASDRFGPEARDQEFELALRFIEELDLEIQEINASCEAKKFLNSEIISALKKEIIKINAINIENHELKNQIILIRASRSWRLTKPIRSIGSLLRILTRKK